MNLNLIAFGTVFFLPCKKESVLSWLQLHTRLCVLSINEEFSFHATDCEKEIVSLLIVIRSYLQSKVSILFQF